MDAGRVRAIGAFALLVAAGKLVREARLAVRGTLNELDYIRKVVERKTTMNVAALRKARGRAGRELAQLGHHHRVHFEPRYRHACVTAVAVQFDLHAAGFEMDALDRLIPGIGL